MEGKELEALRLDKDEAAAEWIDPSPRLREDTVALKSLAAPAKHVVTKCQALESMNKFYLLGDARGQGFGSDLWYHEGLRYDLVNLSTQWENETSNWKELTNLNVRVEELSE